MMDVVNQKTRSRMMSGIRSRNTIPEVLIRKHLFRLGFRYRINDKRLSGTPDLVFPKYHAVIFVHGCFWHGHDCAYFRIPKTRTDFWVQKIETNRHRDANVLNQLHADGWRICIVWECAVRGKKQLLMIDDLTNRISDWLISDSVWLEVRKLAEK